MRAPVLAEVGRAEVLAVPAPHVAIRSTGNELVPPGDRPDAGQIRNSNGPMLVAAALQAGAVPVNLGIARDEHDELRERLAEGLRRQVLIVSGGVSTGGSAEAGTGAACGASLDVSSTPSSDLILSQSSGGGSTASTMTLSSPSRRSHIRTDAAKPGSSVSNASACSRSSADSVPSTYSAASASWASSYITALIPSSCHQCPIHSRISSRLRRNHVLIVFTGMSSLVESCSRLQPL